MHDAELIGTGAVGNGAQAGWRTLVLVHRLAAERAPHALELARVRIEHGHAMIAVAIGDKQFVGTGKHPHIRRLVQVLRVGVALALRAAADLHHEPAVLREFQQLVVPDGLQPGELSPGAIVAAQPDVALVVDMDAVLSFGPFVAARRSAPRLDEVARSIEHDDRRRGHRCLIGRQRARTVQHPDVALRIDGDAGGISQLPLWRHLRPGGIHLERRHGSFRGRCLACELLPRAGDDDRSRQNGTIQNLSLHVFLLRWGRWRTRYCMLACNARNAEARMSQGTWTDHFPGNFMWSNATLVCKGMAPYGAVAVGEIEQVCERLAARGPEDPDAWWQEWCAMAERNEKLADAAAVDGRDFTAGDHYLRAGNYYYTGERFVPPGERKLGIYKKALRCYQEGLKRRHRNIEFVEVPYEGKALPAYFMKADVKGRAPTVVLFDGMDNCKEMSVLFAGLEFARRGMNTLAIDGPGQGETLRLRKIYARHDYEVPGTAAYEFVAKRADVDPEKVVIMG
ncbi:MAG: alpha/beta hydrolase, partial [Betaproteobacteria bacterium]